MFILQLIRSLNGWELKRLEERVAAHGRDSLDRLFLAFREFRDKEGEPEKEFLFKKTFGEAYSKKDDYKLRKEMQYLRGHCRDFLVYQAFEEEMETYPDLAEYYLIRGMERYKLAGEIDKRVEGGPDKRETTLRPQYTLQKDMELFMHSLRPRPANADELDRADRAAERVRESLLRSFLCQYRIYDNYYNALQYYREAVTGSDAFRARQGNLSADRDYDSLPGFLDEFRGSYRRQEDNLTRYYELSAQLYLSDGEDAIDINKQILEILQHTDIQGFDRISSLLRTEGNLGMALGIAGRNEEAEKHFRSQLDICREAGRPVLPIALMNMAFNYLVMAEYGKCISVIDEYADLVESPASYRDILNIYKAFACLFLKDAKGAVRAIGAPSRTLAEHRKMFHRFIYAIAHYLDEETDLALNELRNMSEVIRTREVEQGALLKEVIPVLRTYFSLPYRSKDPAVQAARADLRRAVEELSAHRPHAASLELLWLKRQLG